MSESVCRTRDSRQEAETHGGATSAAEQDAMRFSPLAELVRSHLSANHMRQIDFCRQTGFDQGLLSKILSSVVNTLNVESALKLAQGMNVAPAVVFEAIGKKEIDEMLRLLYSDGHGIEAAK